MKFADWNSFDSLMRGQIKRIIEDDPGALSDEALSAISNNLYLHERLRWLLTLLNFLLVGYLLANIGGLNINVEVLGARIGSTLPIREVVLLSSSIIGVIIFSLVRQLSLFEFALAAHTEKKFPVGHGVVMLRYRRLFGYPLMQLEAPGWNRLSFPQFMLSAISFVSLILATVVLLIVYFLVHLFILWEMWRAPDVPVVFNRLIIFAVLLFDTGTFFGSLFFQLPLPSRTMRANSAAK